MTGYAWIWIDTNGYGGIWRDMDGSTGNQSANLGVHEQEAPSLQLPMHFDNC